MIAVEVKTVGVRADGKKVVEATIISDTVPSPLPVDGTDVDGLPADCVFAPFSVIYIVGNAARKVYVANESGVFIAQ